MTFPKRLLEVCCAQAFCLAGSLLDDASVGLGDLVNVDDFISVPVLTEIGLADDVVHHLVEVSRDVVVVERGLHADSLCVVCLSAWSRPGCVNLPRTVSPDKSRRARCRLSETALRAFDQPQLTDAVGGVALPVAWY